MARQNKSRSPALDQTTRIGLEQAAVDPSVYQDTRDKAQGDGRGPFEVTEEGIFSACLAHQGDTGGRADGEQATTDTRG